MAYKRYVKKVAKKVGRAVKSRYFSGKGYSKPKIGQMVKDISMIKGMLNTEKKRVTQTSGTDTFLLGQVNFNNSGHWLADITPNPQQGVGVENKTGNSIKVVGSHFDFQFWAQHAMISGQRIKIQVIQVLGQPFSTVTDILGKFITPTAFVTGGTIYDINSDRDQDYYKNFRVLLTKYAYLKPDDMSGETSVARVKFGMKYNMHIRNNNNDPTLSSGQLIMLITADRGNCNSANNSGLGGVPVIPANTGSVFRFENVHYFVDN